MYSTLETIAIIAIIIAQVIITIHAYRQIKQMKSFLPNGKVSLKLKEYEIPSDKILEIVPSQVVDKISYLVKDNNLVDVNEDGVQKQPRDERGRFISKKEYSYYEDIIESDL